MLLGKVIVGFSHFLREHQAVGIETPLLSKFLEGLFSEHLAQGIRRINRSVDQDMHFYVNTPTERLDTARRLPTPQTVAVGASQPAKRSANSHAE